MAADVLRLNVFGLKNKYGGFVVPMFILTRLIRSALRRQYPIKFAML